MGSVVMPKATQISKIRASLFKNNTHGGVDLNKIVLKKSRYPKNVARVERFIDEKIKETQNIENGLHSKSIYYLDTAKTVFVPLQFFGEVNIITSKRGEGKSWDIGVLCEIGTEYKVPQYVVDRKGANLGLAKLKNWKVARVGKKDPKEFADEILKKAYSYVIHANMDVDKINEWLAPFLHRCIKKMPRGIKHFYFDEASRYCGKKGTPSQKAITELITEERSKGFGASLVDQNMMELNHVARRQRDTLIAHYLTDSSIQAIDEMMKEEILNGAERKKIIEDLQKSEPGECYIMSKTLKIKEEGATV